MSFSKVMSAATALLFVVLLGYAAAWFLGKVHGDFSAALLILTVITFVYWLLDKVYLKPRRVAQAQAVQAKIVEQQGANNAQDLRDVIRKAVEPVLTPPWWIEWTAGFFWVILIVFVLRSFVAEPFRIPSGSMEPTLVPQDFILVNKFSYGLRLPVFNSQITEGSAPQRGDVVVFRWPVDERITYIKRIVGLPGDEVTYRNKVLMVNGQVVSTTVLSQDYIYQDQGSSKILDRFEETLGSVSHQIAVDPSRVTYISGAVGMFPNRQNCRYMIDGFTCKVPEGHYFMMGDNRDHSSDSRYWGFVPAGNIVGKAFFIWMNPKQFSRIGGFK